MHLNDSLVNRGFEVVYTHHEQAAAMAAVAYAKTNNKTGLAVTTTGCGSTNAITGLLDAWQDSIPVIFISGQVNVKHTCTIRKGIRKLGVQDSNIIDIVKPITKYAKIVTEASQIQEALETAVIKATMGRPGPVWLDIPLDIQSAYIEEPTKEKVSFVLNHPTKPTWQLSQLVEKMNAAERPIFLVGNGVYLAGAERIFCILAKEANIPYVTTFLGKNVSPEEEGNLGTVGIKGSRSGNFALQRADLVIAIGTSLSVPVTGYNFDHFAPDAEVVVIDIDQQEHQKDTVKIDELIVADALFACNYLLNLEPKYNCWKWRAECLDNHHEWGITKKSSASGPVSIYTLLKQISKIAMPDTVFVADAGSAFYASCQALKLRNKQKLIVPGAQAEMGFTIPGMLGAAKANPDSLVFGITGEGSFMTNVQELQTLKDNGVCGALFVIKNGGYSSIKNTQDKFFGRRTGVDENSGVGFPRIEKAVRAFDITAYTVDSTAALDDISALQCKIRLEGLVVFVVDCIEQEQIIPSLAVEKAEDGTIITRPLEDMYPLMSREEFHYKRKGSPLE